MHVLKDFYPRPHQREVFAVRTFNEEWHETSYYIDGIGNTVTFNPPRIWHPSLLAPLQRANNIQVQS